MGVGDETAPVNVIGAVLCIIDNGSVRSNVHRMKILTDRFSDEGMPLHSACALVARVAAGTFLCIASFVSIAPAQTVRGTVFDSLTMRPLAGASVWVQGGSQSAIADSTGHFEIANVPAGERFVAFSSPALDSLGLSTLGTMMNVSAGNSVPIQLASPSFPTIARALCRGTVFASDSGIIWGTVRDAATETRLVHARTAMQWAAPRVTGAKSVSVDRGSREVRTDSTGTYYVCGVPTGILLSIEASGAKSASGIVEYSIGMRRVARLDLTVSTEMTALTNARDTATAKGTLAVRGTSTIHGIVYDDKRQIVSKAAIRIGAIDSVTRSNTEGRFIVAGLPAGTSMLDVRQVGFAPFTTLVDLVPGKTVDVVIVLRALSELETFKVTASREASRDRDEFEERKRTGFGYTRDRNDFRMNFDVVSALQSIPSLNVSKYRGVVSISAPQGVTMQSPCTVKIFIDGFRATADMVDAIGIDDLRAIEWYPTAARTPSRFMTDCSTLVLWTSRSKWSG